MRFKKFGNLFLAKLKTVVTFAPVIRMTIIIYGFGVEKNFPCRGNFTGIRFRFKHEKSAVY